MNETLGLRLEALEARLSALCDQGRELPGRAVPWPMTRQELSSAVAELHAAAEALAAVDDRAAEDRRRYRDLFELAPDGYAVTDEEGIVLDINRVCARLIGEGPDRLTGRPLTGYLAAPAPDAGIVPRVLSRLREGDDQVLAECRLRRRGQGDLPVSIRAGAVRNPAGRLTGVRWLIHDDADRARATEAEQVAVAGLREDADRLASLDKAKSDFLNLVSHELRSPLAVVRGYVSMLADGSLGPLAPSAAAAIPVVVGRCDEMAALVTQMLETARLDDGRVELARSRADLGEVVADAARSLPARSQASPHQVVVSLPGHPVMVDIDRARVLTILVNLLDNAVKYSPGEPEVVCRLEVDATAGVASVAVRDTGMGMADTAALFTRFGRVVTPENRHIAGTGLGLYLARELARAHGGEVTADSAPGRGSRFTLSLPLAPAPATP